VTRLRQSLGVRLRVVVEVAEGGVAAGLGVFHGVKRRLALKTAHSSVSGHHIIQL
jgi:hypothetical protein